jgi:hypothetical protein
VPDIETIKRLLDSLNDDQCREVLQYLRARVPIHPIETKLNAQAEVILEAIDRASDLTLRGVRGIIAEAAFAVGVVSELEGWREIVLGSDMPYDFLLEDAVGQVRVQVKMQRRVGGRPMSAKEASRMLSADMFVVETQRTRGGVDRSTGEDTRPYRFGEFDVIAVSMHPSTNNWDSFMYTVGDWLLPRQDNSTQLMKFQPVSPNTNEDWTSDFITCVSRFRSGKKKHIRA